MELFGNKAGPAIAKAVRDGRLSFDELSATVTDWGDSVNDTFTETLDPIDQWQMTMNDLKLAGAEVGSVIGELLAPMLQKAADVIRDLKQKWDELSPGTQQAIVAAAGVLAVVGPIVMLIGSLVTGIGGLITSVGAIATALGVSVGVVGGVVAAIAALIAIIVLCITHWDDIKAKVKEVWESISTYMANLKEAVANKWNEIKQEVADKIQSIKTDLQEKWAQIKSDAIQKITDMKNDAIQKFVDLKDGIKKKIDEIKGFFTNLVLKIPKPELPSLPSFSLKTATKTILGKDITYPTGFDIDWNAIAMNTPKLFTSPTVMQTPYGMLGAGEAGHEIMYGHANLMNDIQNATAANNDALIDGIYAAFSAALQQADLTVEINEREFGRILREARA
jgi:phage-related tail protein